MMDAVAYDAWHDTPREHWIGDGEFRLLADMLRLRSGESLLDIWWSPAKCWPATVE